jgi:hypothetical protein
VLCGKLLTVAARQHQKTDASTREGRVCALPRLVLRIAPWRC